MCGIFAVVNDEQKTAAQLTLESLKKLEYRGYDSWGVAIVGTDGKIKVEKEIGKIGEATTSLPSSTIGLGHTRWATHGGVTQANAHPHLDCSKTVAVVHNGIVENYEKLKSELQQKGHHFHSETDTEVIAHLVEEHLKKMSFREAVFKSFSEIEGSNAIVVLDGTSQHIVACKNSSPLLLGVKNKTVYLASDAVAFLHFTDQAYILEDNEAVEITPQSYIVFDALNGSEKKVELSTLLVKAEDISKGEFPHFFLKEVHEQPVVLERLFKEKKSVHLGYVKNLIQESKHVIIIGCGSAYHCGLIGSYLFAKTGINVQVFQAHEFLQFSSLFSKDTVVLTISQSGETIDTLLAAKEAKLKGATIVGIINARGSSLERLADFSLPVLAGPEIAVVSSKAFTAQLFMLAMLAGYEDSKEFEVFLVGLKSLFDKDFLDSVQALAKKLKDIEHLYIIGKGLNYPTALEAALKLKETSYLHAEAFAAGELKHGVLSLVTKESYCIALISEDETSKDTLSNATEIASRGGKIIGFAPLNQTIFTEYIRVPNAGKLHTILHVVVSQLLAYYLGLERGADPDKPRNLAKSVTVK